MPQELVPASSLIRREIPHDDGCAVRFGLPSRYRVKPEAGLVIICATNDSQRQLCYQPQPSYSASGEIRAACHSAGLGMGIHGGG